MTAEVHIILGEEKNALTIPSAALTKGADGSYTVRVIGDDGDITTRKVEVGLNNKVMAEIKSGLTKNERVVTGEATASSTSSNTSQGGPPPMGF
jgi:membrane fusion protein, macrolide-specific efflux system